MTKLYELSIEGMKCGSCAKKVGDSLKEMTGVEVIRFVSPERKSALVQVDETKFELEEASKMIQEKGYQFLGAKEVDEASLNQTKTDSGCNVQ